jgi:calcineurin-like phosphoesterase family protein
LSTFFTGDTHFGHKNIIKYCNRPFSSVEEMDQQIIKRWNSKISKKDLVFHVGDFCFGDRDSDFDKYFYALNGRIIFIKGNHDSLAWKNKDKFESFCAGYYEAKIDNQIIVLNHYAMRVWNKAHYGTWHLYGHSHGMLPSDINSLSMDCGVDTHNFYPWSFEEVKEVMKKKEFVPINEREQK